MDANAAFARPGPRLIDGVEALAGIFHPTAAASRGPPWPAAFAEDRAWGYRAQANGVDNPITTKPAKP